MPFPYMGADADWWLDMVRAQDGREGLFRAIVVQGEVVGNISVERMTDVYRCDAQLGYFLETEHWSKGIMTEAVGQMCRLAFACWDIERITAQVCRPNVASCRVLEKNGFALEGTLRRAFQKDELLCDLCLYGKLR